MKDVLLKTMIKEGMINEEDKNHPSVVYSISKIADIVKAFDEWKDKNVQYLEYNSYAPVKYNGILTYNQLFNYWYNKIREK